MIEATARRLALGALFLAFAPAAHAQELQLVAGANHFCILDAEGAKCWGGARRYGGARVGLPGGPCLTDPTSDACKRDDAVIAPRFRRILDARRIFANGENTCALGPAGLECWGRLASPEDAPRLVDASEVILGATHVCAWREAQFQCYGLDGAYMPSGRHSFAPDLRGRDVDPEASAAGANSTCVHANDALTCFTAWDISQGGRRFPGPVHTATIDIVDLCMLQASRSCVGREDKPVLHCARLLRSDSSMGFDPFTVCGEHMRRPRAVAMGATWTCVLDDDGVACIDRYAPAGHFPSLRRVPALGPAEQIAMAGDTVCALGGVELACWNVASQRLEPPPIDMLDLALLDFRLDILDRAFVRAVDFVYADKGAFFTGLAELARAFPLSAGDEGVKARLMLINAVKPVIEMTVTPFFTRSVQPVYARRLAEANAAHGFDGALAHLGRTPATRRVAIEAMRLALTTTRGYVADPAQLALIDSAVAACGRALARGATDAAMAEAVPAIDAAEGVLAELAAGVAAPGRGVLMLSLLEFMREAH